MEDAKQHDQEENAEKGGKDVRVAAGEQDEGDKCGDAAVEDGGSNVDQGALGPVPPGAGYGQEGVAYVGGVVNT